MKKKSSIKVLAPIAMLAAVAYLLAFIEIQLPLSPTFARMDVSDLPALIASFALGPVCGVVVELVKNGLQLLSTNTAGVGELANFLMGAALCFPAGLLYRGHKTKRRALIGCTVGTLCMTLTAGVMNYFVLLPMYEMFMPLSQVIASFAAYIPFIQTKLDVVLWNVLPFNLLKGVLICVITMLIYKPLSPILKGKNPSCR